MGKPNPTATWEKNLKELSEWACVAFAARCAQRVLPLYNSYRKSIGHASTDEVQNAVAIALEAAETAGSSITANSKEFSKSADFVSLAKDAINKENSKLVSHSVEYYAHAAAHQAVTAAYAAVETVKSAIKGISNHRAHAAAAATFSESASAAGAQSETRAKVSNTADPAILNAGQMGYAIIKKAMWHDFEILCELSAAVQSKKNKRIHVARLGMLWQESKPSWIPEITENKQAEEQFELDTALEVYVEPGNASKETIQRVFEAISKLHIALGGAGLEFRSDGEFVSARQRVEA